MYIYMYNYTYNTTKPLLGVHVLSTLSVVISSCMYIHCIVYVQPTSEFLQSGEYSRFFLYTQMNGKATMQLSSSRTTIRDCMDDKLRSILKDIVFRQLIQL